MKRKGLPNLRFTGINTRVCTLSTLQNYQSSNWKVELLTYYLEMMLGYVRKGDTVIVESISRFARNTKDLLELIEKLKEKNVEVYQQEGKH